MTDTALTIIEQGLKHLGGIMPGESMTDDEAQDGRRLLNGMLESWAAAGLPCFGTTLTSHTLVASDGDYTIGPSGADITAVRPIRILEAFTRDDNNYDRPITVIPIEQYDRITSKTIDSPYPWWLAYDPTWPNGTFYLYPEPRSAYTLYIRYEAQLGPLSTLATSFSMPPGYQRAIEYNLAIEMAPTFRLDVPRDVYLLADTSKENIERVNAAAKVPRRRTDVPRTPGRRGLGGRYNAYNVYSDGYGHGRW